MGNTGLVGVRGGNSGDLHDFHYWTMGSNFEEVGAVFAIVKKNDFWVHDKMLHLEETDNLKITLKSHPQWDEWLGEGADHVLVLEKDNKAERHRIYEDVKIFYMTE